MLKRARVRVCVCVFGTRVQVQDCRAMLTLYRERMEVVLAQRRTLANQLAACMGALQVAEV